MTKISFLCLLTALFIFTGCSGDAGDHQYTGILEGTSVQVPALTPGQITQIPVKTGEYIEKNQLLAVVDSTDLIYQREQLTAARDELTIQKEIARINVSRANKDYAYLKTTHDRVALFFDGKIQITDKADNLRAQYKYPLFQIKVKELNPMIDLFNSVKEVHTIQKFGDALHISFHEIPNEARWENWKNETEDNLLSWEQIEPSIEDIFLDMMESMDE
jgi:hypothetical protein